ncbi:MAG: c-type cytochrome [Proteobacteria bacterium]|nr:c-type cytochrome [Pseudomonadota bacterium]
MRRNQLGLILAALLLPALAWAFTSAKQELAQALRNVPDMKRGAQLYRQCAACHGPDGAGTKDGNNPRIAGQHVAVLVKQLVDYRHNRRWDIHMEHYAGKDLLADAQSLKDVSAYIHRLEPAAPPGRGGGELASHGANVYGRLCESCHGESALGNRQKMVPRIAGQHYDYLMRQIYDGADGRRPNFSPVHIRLFGRLDRRDIVGLSDYLSRLEPGQHGTGTVALAQ